MINSSDAMPTLMTTSEVADVLRTSRRTVRRLSDAGRLPWVQVGDSIRRFDERDVLAFLAECRGGARG